MRCLRIALIIIAILFNKLTSAQPELFQDTSSLQNAEHFFYKKINERAHLYTGKEYYKYEAGVKGFPFYLNEDEQTGEISYDGTVYKNVPMMFDAVRQVVVTDGFNATQRMELLTEKIQYFILSGHRFETVLQVNDAESAVSKGLYDVMYKGKVSVMIKRIKKITKGLHAEDPYSFTEEDEYYIKNGKDLFAISNKNGVLAALDDKKNLVQIFIRKNKLRFKKYIQQDIIQVAVYYSSLN